MAVDNHRHCQRTVCPAYYGYQDGESHASEHTWKTIDQLILNNLPNNWKASFQGNSNITDDFADVLTMLNTSIGTINNTINGINGRLTIVEGQTGQLTASSVICYIAPNNDWYYANSDKTITDGTSTFIWHQDASDGNRIYYTLNPRKETWSDASPNWAYVYGSDHRIYPGDDTNIELQYRATGDAKKKYPVFTLNQALQYLRRFRSASVTTYRILTQCGDYHYYTQDGNTYTNLKAQNIQLSDATGGSTLVIGPNFDTAKLENMPCAKSNKVLSNTVNDSDFVKVRFMWTDYERQYQAGTWPINLGHSTILIDGCGFVLLRKRATYTTTIGATYMNVRITGGKTTFSNCLFRNCRIDTQLPDTSPTLRFYTSPIYADDLNKYRESDFNHANIWKYFLPTIFVDDNIAGIDGIKTSFIMASNGDNTNIQFTYPYIVFSNINRTHTVIDTYANNSLTWYIHYSYLSQIIFDYSINLPPPTKPIFNRELTTMGWQQASTPTDAIAKTPGQQGRLWVRRTTSSTKPSWLEQPIDVFYNPTDGYDATTGSYNAIISKISAAPDLVWWNNTPGTDWST